MMIGLTISPLSPSESATIAFCGVKVYVSFSIAIASTGTPEIIGLSNLLIHVIFRIFICPPPNTQLSEEILFLQQDIEKRDGPGRVVLARQVSRALRLKPKLCFLGIICNTVLFRVKIQSFMIL
jgi:hypothetical protein